MQRPHEVADLDLGSHDVAVSLTFDFDADFGIAWNPMYGGGRHLTTISDRRFGATRGMPRILDLLAEKEIRATFYVPGEVAELHPDLTREILAQGHEIGHHGYTHLATDRASEVEQRDEVVRGFDALERVTGQRPTGFRSPAWELTPTTFELIAEAGFEYDSSCMGDDRPYYERHEQLRILELPVHWSLDDLIYYWFTRDGGGAMSDPHALENAFLGEFDAALRDRRHITYTMHPECTGRGYRTDVLRRMIDEMRSRANVWFAPHGDVARKILAG